MMPKRFEHIVSCYTIDSNSLREELERLKKQVATVEKTVKQQDRVRELCKYLINGETMAGFFGASPTYAFFVRQYRTESSKAACRTELVEVDLVIIPDLLVEHVLRVNIPSSTTAGVSTNTPAKVDVSGIVKRMLEHAHNAKNVSVGTFADVLCETCNGCGGQVPVVAFDEHLDDDNGREFTVNRLCGACGQVDRIAIYRCEYRVGDNQYCVTDGIYK